MTFILDAGSTWAVIVVAAGAIAAPVWWLWFRASSGVTSDLRASCLLAIAALALLGNHLLLRAPRVGPFADLGWNWQGKLLALAGSLLLLALWSGLSWREVGVAVPRADAWRPVLVLSVAAVVVFLVFGSDAEARGGDVETLLFQATMPGLEEELFYRGILWALIDRALPRKRLLFGAWVGMGFVVSTVLFGLGHGVVVADGGTATFVLAPVVFTGVAGAVFGWVRARTHSVLPAIALHNVLNVAIHVTG